MMKLCPFLMCSNAGKINSKSLMCTSVCFIWKVEKRIITIGTIDGFWSNKRFLFCFVLFLWCFNWTLLFRIRHSFWEDNIRFWKGEKVLTFFFFDNLYTNSSTNSTVVTYSGLLHSEGNSPVTLTVLCCFSSLGHHIVLSLLSRWKSWCVFHHM